MQAQGDETKLPVLQKTEQTGEKYLDRFEKVCSENNWVKGIPLQIHSQSFHKEGTIWFDVKPDSDCAYCR